MAQSEHDLISQELNADYARAGKCCLDSSARIIFMRTYGGQNRTECYRPKKKKKCSQKKTIFNLKSAFRSPEDHIKE